MNFGVVAQGTVGVLAQANPVTGNAIQTVGSIQIGGTAGTTGITFPDATVQTTAMAPRMRKLHVGAGLFIGDGAIAGSVNFSAAPYRNRAVGVVLGDNSSNVATATFTIPLDYVNGQAFPSITLLWATDADGTSVHKVDCDISFGTVFSTLSGPGAGVPFRYNFRQGHSGPNCMESLAPAQSQITAQTMPAAGDSFFGPPTWNAGDTIIMSIGRNGFSASDPNTGNMYIYGVEFTYLADR